MHKRPIRVMAVIEAATVTGPAKNLLEFGRLAKDEVELLIVTFRRGPVQGNDVFFKAVEAAGLRWEAVSETGPTDWSVTAKLEAIARQFEADLVQTHGVKSHFLAWLGGIGKRYPWLAWHHGYTRPTWKQGLYNHLDRISLRGARLVVTVTGAFLKELLSAGVEAGRTRVIPNAISPDWWAEGRGGAREAGLVLGVGRLSKEKAFGDLLEAMALVQKQYAGARLVLVGEGYEREQLQAQAGRLGVRCEFAGQVRDVRPFYERASVFALSSHSEGSPNVVIEAMAAGLPVVATRVGGVGETLLDGEEGLLVEASQPEQLAAGIVQLLTDPARGAAMSLRASQRVAREMNPARRVQSIIDAYRFALGPKPGQLARRVENAG